MTSSASSPAIANRLSLNDWERIAFYLVVSGCSFLGPPSSLCALSLVSRDIHDAISVKKNSRLYARLFRFKFDLAAPTRRLSERWLTSRCLASELIKRFTALQRIRLGVDFRHEDLWTCYLMMLENDGKNESQLIDWGRLDLYLCSLVTTYVRSPQKWYSDTQLHSLALWLLWMTASRSNIREEQPEFSEVMVAILHPFLVAGYQMPSTYSPDSNLHLPICSRTTAIIPHCSGPPPVTAEIMHYSHKLTLAVPIVTPAATLIMTVRTEELQDWHTFPADAGGIPPNRITANALGVMGPTLEDILSFHFDQRIQVPDRRPPAIDSDFDQCDAAGGVEQDGSRRYDEDWSRLAACHSPWSSALRGKVFSPGSLAGSWEGRLMIPDFEPYLSLILGAYDSPFSVSLYHQPLYWTLEEHHCLDPNDPLLAGTGTLGDDDFLNAWLPRGLTVNHLDGAIEVFDPVTNQMSRYETFNPGTTAHYSKSAHEIITTPWISEDLYDDSLQVGHSEPNSTSRSQNSMPESSYIDDDDEYEDTVSHKSSGINDILITGEVNERYGDAWGYYTIIGRVRPWDGLVVLLRTPRGQDQIHHGRWVFRGYIHDKNLVGRWRETSTPLGSIGIEGAFVVCRP